MRRYPFHQTTILLVSCGVALSCGGKDSTGPESGNGGSTQPTVATVEVTPATVTFGTIGRTTTLSAAAKDASGNTLSRTFTWTASNAVVAVSSAGVVTAQQNGTATVTATADGVPGSATVVVEQVVVSIDVSPEDVTAQVLNLPLSFSAGALDSLDNAVVDATGSFRDDFTWSTSDATVATVALSGQEARVTPLMDGNAVITASMDGVEGTATVVVSGTMSLDWMFQVGASQSSIISGGIVGTPAIAPDGTLYLGALDGKLYAINPDGSEKWAYDTGTEIVSSPAIATDGTVYVGSLNGTLYALNPDGSVKWTFAEPMAAFWASPAIGPDGTIYIGSSAFYAVNPDGTKRWEFDAGASVFFSSAAIGADATIYFGSETGALTALMPDGSLRWQFTTTAGFDISSSPAIGADGTIYFGSSDNTLYAVNPDGSSKWSYSGSRTFDSSPAIATDGTVYIGDADRSLHAVNSDGTLKWTADLEDEVFSSPAIDANGTVYAGSEGLRSVDPGGTVQLVFPIGEVFSSPVIGTDGTIYIGSDSGVLYAFSSLAAGVGPMNSPWPKFRHDLRNTGYVGTL
jgi:outer membrane protein assembly factor BamB